MSYDHCPNMTPSLKNGEKKPCRCSYQRQASNVLFVPYRKQYHLLQIRLCSHLTRFLYKKIQIKYAWACTSLLSLFKVNRILAPAPYLKRSKPTQLGCFNSAESGLASIHLLCHKLRGWCKVRSQL